MSPPRPASRRLRLTAGISGWLFGLASTVLLVGLWGRAVVVDTDELAQTLSPLAASDMVADRLADWLETELVDAGMDGASATDAAGEVLTHHAVGPLLEDLVAEGVGAASSSDPSGGTVDVGALLQPASGEITAGLTAAGLAVTEAEVSSALADLDPLVIRGAADRPLIGESSPLASTMGAAVWLGALLMTVSALAYTTSHRDRLRALRSLLNRFALGALSFAVLLKIGGWLVDPAGGRAPVGETLALLADSKWMLPLSLGLTSFFCAGIVWLFRKRVTPVAVSPSQPEQPIRQEA